MSTATEQTITVEQALHAQDVRNKPHETMGLRKILREYKTGDELSWEAEFQWLRLNHPGKLRQIAKTLLLDGFKEPILLGNDGRVWDGHHRLYIAYHFGIRLVPVRRAGA